MNPLKSHIKTDQLSVRVDVNFSKKHEEVYFFLKNIVYCNSFNSFVETCFTVLLFKF